MMVLELFSPERAAVMRLGAQAAQAAAQASFPPRPEDPTGTLVPMAVSSETNRLVREHVRATVGDRDRRRWWMEGLVVGFAAEAVSSLLRSEEETHVTVIEHLTSMEAAVLAKAAGPAREASSAVFAVLRAVVAGDPVALPWAVENLWATASAQPARLALAEVEARVRAVASCAVMTCCAAWAIEVGCTSETP